MTSCPMPFTSAEFHEVLFSIHALYAPGLVLLFLCFQLPKMYFSAISAIPNPAHSARCNLNTPFFLSMLSECSRKEHLVWSTLYCIQVSPIDFKVMKTNLPYLYIPHSISNIMHGYTIGQVEVMKIIAQDFLAQEIFSSGVVEGKAKGTDLIVHLTGNWI